MNAKKMIAAFAVLAMALAAFAVIPADGISGDDDKYVEMKGDFTSQLTMTSEQTVVVVDDLNIIGGGKLTILGDFIVKEGKTVTIEGYADNVGYAADYSKLMIYGNATIDGNIVSKVEGGLEIEPGSHGAPAGDYNVTINGNINVLGDTSGTPVKSATLTADLAQTNSKSIVVKGAVTVGTNAEVEFTKVMFTEDAVLNVLGIANGKIIIKGTVNFDGATDEAEANPVASPDALEINIKNDSAVINLINVAGKIVVTDNKMHAYSYGGVQYYIGAVPTHIPTTSGGAIVAAISDKDSPANTIEFTDVKNIRITEKITTEIEDGIMIGTTEMKVAPIDAANAVGVVDTPVTSGASFTVNNGGKTVAIDAMVIDDVAVTIAGEAKVIGEVTVLKAATPKAFTVNGKLTVEGLVFMKKDQTITGEDKVVAAKYIIKAEDNTVDTYYTTLQKAIDNGATDITMTGKLIVEKDITVPSPVKLTTAEITGDHTVEIKDGATLAIANGAQYILNGDMLVAGAFVIENIDYGITLGLHQINADVLLKDGVYRMYTDIYNAFAKAEAGAELSAYNPAGSTIIICDDLTIPAGMSFNNYSDYKSEGVVIELGKAAVLTVAGKLIVSDDKKLGSSSPGGWNSKTTKVDPATGAVVDCSVIAIGPQGVIEFAAKTGTFYSGYTVAGAYFQEDSKYYITNVPLAFQGILDATDNTVTVAGDVTLDNLTVNGTEKERILIVIKQGSEITMKNFTFSYGKVVVERSLYDITGPELKMNDPTILTGDIGTSSGRMIFSDAVVFDPVVFDYEFIDDSMNLMVRGIDKANKDKEAYFDNAETKPAYLKSDDPTSISGTVYISQFKYFGTYEAKKDFSNMRFVVPAGAQLFVIGDSEVYDAELLIEGTMTVKYPGKIAAAIYSVLGTMNVEKIDGNSGEARIAYAMFVGGSTESFNNLDLNVKPPAGSASINGAGKFVFGPNAQLSGMGVIGVFSGASVTADVLVDWMANTAKSTEFYVDNALWLTGYQAWQQAGAFTIYKIEPALSDVTFEGWQTYDEKSKTYTYVPDTVYVGAAGYEKVYADIDTTIYTINVNADQGIDNVYIDGILMTKTVATNSYTADVAAGTHTLSYTLANGYTGNAVITTIDGAKLVGGGLSFVANDAKAGDDKIMDITLSGIVKSGYDTDPETHPETSNGLSVTEILLIVVVIIMAVMAIVLIMRLNRS